MLEISKRRLALPRVNGDLHKEIRTAIFSERLDEPYQKLNDVGAYLLNKLMVRWRERTVTAIR